MEDDRVIPAVEYLDQAPVGTAHPSVTTVSDPLMQTGGSTPQVVAQLANYTMMDLVQIFVVYAFIIAAGLSAVFIFIGGMSFILSGGNEEKIKKAVNTIRYAIVGLIITILSFTFVTIVGRVFGLNFLDYLSYDKIRASIEVIVSSAKRDGGSSANTPHFSLPRN